MALTVSERVLAAREAGNVMRCHVVPHHGEYSVGKHSYDALSLLLILHPNPSPDLMKGILWHDGGERWVGDMPAPAKWYDDRLGQAYESAEDRARRLWELDVKLTPDEIEWLKAVDRIELWLWCHEQRQFGNRHIETFFTHLDRYFKDTMKTMPQPCQDFLRDFSWQRLPEQKKEFGHRV